MKIKTGVTRIVLLVNKFAIKLPSFRNGWRCFLQGILANEQERVWSAGLIDDRLCPVIISSRFGFWLAMRRADEITELPPRENFNGLPLDYKLSNFGLLDGRIVLVDYGS